MYGKKGHTRVVAAVQTRKAKLTHVVRDKQGNSSLTMAVEGPGHPLQHRGDTVTPLCYGHSCQDTLWDPQGWPDQSKVCFCHTNAVGLLQEKQDNALGFLLHRRPELAAHPELRENS